MRVDKFRLNLLERIVFSLIPKVLLKRIVFHSKRFGFFRETQNSALPLRFTTWYQQMVKGHCNTAYWPVHITSHVGGVENIQIGFQSYPGFSPGNYIQAKGILIVGNYVRIGPNVGIITTNHNIFDNRKQTPASIFIGDYCWIGMGATILPDVELGDFTIVGAGAIVTKSFPEGHCILAGNPATKIKDLDRQKCVRYSDDESYIGYIETSDFEAYKRGFLSADLMERS